MRVQGGREQGVRDGSHLLRPRPDEPTPRRRRASERDERDATASSACAKATTTSSWSRRGCPWRHPRQLFALPDGTQAGHLARMGQGVFAASPTRKERTVSAPTSYERPRANRALFEKANGRDQEEEVRRGRRAVAKIVERRPQDHLSWTDLGTMPSRSATPRRPSAATRAPSQ